MLNLPKGKTKNENLDGASGSNSTWFRDKHITTGPTESDPIKSQVAKF